MKKIILFMLLVIASCELKAQTYSSTHITVVSSDSMLHDSTQCMSRRFLKYAIAVDTSFLGDTLRVVDTFGIMRYQKVNSTGASPWSFTASILDDGWDDRYLWDVPFVSGPTPPGYAHFYNYRLKVTTHVDTLKWLPTTDSIYVTNPCEYDTATGHVWFDDNANCTLDVGEHGLNHYDLFFTEHVSSGGVPSFNIGGSGTHYQFLVQKSWMVDYTFSIPSYYPFIYNMPSCAPGSSYTFATLPQAGIDFPLRCTSNIDVQCYALTNSAIRQFEPFIMHPYVSNMGCDSTHGLLTLVKDSHAIYNASLSSVPADYVSGDTLVWHYSGLSNTSAYAYWNSFMGGIYLTPDSTIIAGDTLCFRVFTNIPSADIDPSNNDYTLCLPVVYSFDPNEKEVVPKGIGANGDVPVNTDTLTYTLHFQNTGTAPAHNIKVIDTLDTHINASSLKVLGTSHQMYPKWLAPNVVQFTYDYIYLPDSTHNEPGSHGSVRFKVALNSGLPAGAQIKNKGYIYFDANPPVTTNTVKNTLSLPSGISALTTVAIKVYPNPATGNVTIEGPANSELVVSDITGMVMHRQIATGTKTTIDVSRLPAGVYTIKSISDLGSAVNRFTKY